MGQFTDALFTPIAGVLSDKTNCTCGKRKGWHIFGLIVCTPSFFFIFFYLSFTAEKSTEFQVLYYCGLSALWNIGWPFVNVAHLTMVNELSYSQRRRDKMVNGRSSANYLARMFVLLVSLPLFVLISSDVAAFKVLLITCLSIGTITTVVFLSLIDEPELSQ